MGISEVGHLTLGASNIIHQDIVKISEAIKSSEFSINHTPADGNYTSGQ